MHRKHQSRLTLLQPPYFATYISVHVALSFLHAQVRRCMFMQASTICYKVRFIACIQVIGVYMPLRYMDPGGHGFDPWECQTVIVVGIT